MPILGYGVYQVTKDECERCVSDALEVGYRLIDTAQSCFNKEEVGAAIAKSGIKREEIFLTTKVWVEHYGYDLRVHPHSPPHADSRYLRSKAPRASMNCSVRWARRVFR